MLCKLAPFSSQKRDKKEGKSKSVLSHSHWTAAKYLHEYQMQAWQALRFCGWPKEQHCMLKGSDSTDPQACRSTPLCHFQDRHTPACSRLIHEVSSKFPQFCKTFPLHGNGLERTKAKLSLLSIQASALLNKNAFKIKSVVHVNWWIEFSCILLAIVQLILPRPEPIQVQSQIIPSFGLSYVSPTWYVRRLCLS